MKEDNQLVLEAQGGSVKAFEELVCRYDRQVLGLAMRYARDAEIAKDLYQEIFLRVYRNLGSFRFQSQFSTWLYRVASNVCLTQVARRKKRDTVSIDEDTQAGRNLPSDVLAAEIAEEADADRNLMRGELAEHISDALLALSPQQRAVFVLRHYEGHKLKEIAAILECAEGTVKKHLFTATRRMRAQLKPVYC